MEEEIRYDSECQVERPLRELEPLTSKQSIEGISIKDEYIPKKQELLKNYEINIRFLSVGCVVRVGCKEIPFTSVSEAMNELTKYVVNPYQETKRWNQIIDSGE